MTMETVSRVLGTFRTEGLIAMTSPSDLTLTQIDRLKKIAEGEA